MQGSSGTNGPQRDEALRRETRGEIRAGRSTRAEEWREPEPPADGEPAVTWALSGKPGADAEAIDLRSDIARNLGRGFFPTTGERLYAALTQRQAPQRLIDLAAALPQDEKFSDVSAALRAMGFAVSAEHD